MLPGFRGTMVHGAYVLYDGYPDAAHQLCIAHVIRELTAQEKLFSHQVWPGQIRWALSQLNKQATAARDTGLEHIPPQQAALYLRVHHQGVAVGLSRHPRTSRTAAQSEATNLLERLRERAHQYLGFTEDLHVEATNNRAEHDLRPVKARIKISGCHQSQTGAAHWLTVRSYTSSAIKNGIGATLRSTALSPASPGCPPSHSKADDPAHHRDECLQVDSCSRRRLLPAALPQSAPHNQTGAAARTSALLAAPHAPRRGAPSAAEQAGHVRKLPGPSASRRCRCAEIDRDSPPADPFPGQPQGDNRSPTIARPDPCEAWEQLGSTGEVTGSIAPE